MDIKHLLERSHSKLNTNKIVDYVGVNKIRFKELVNIYTAGPYRITQRAAWPLSYCIQHHPGLISPHLSGLLKFVRKTGQHVAVKRNTMRLLQYVDVPKKYHADVIDLCFEFLQDKKETVAVKAFSMTVLANLIKDEPDLIKELKIVIEDQLAYATPAFTSRARKVMKLLGY